MPMRGMPIFTILQQLMYLYIEMVPEQNQHVDCLETFELYLSSFILHIVKKFCYKKKSPIDLLKKTMLCGNIGNYKSGFFEILKRIFYNEDLFWVSVYPLSLFHFSIIPFQANPDKMLFRFLIPYNYFFFLQIVCTQFLSNDQIK